MLACLAVMLLLSRLVGRLSALGRGVVAVAAVAGFTAATVQPRFERLPFTAPLDSGISTALPAGSMVVISGRDPLAYAVLRFDERVPFVSMYNNFMAPDQCTRLQARAETRIRAHPGPLWLLTPAAPSPAPGEVYLPTYGLVRDGVCRDVPTEYVMLNLCPLRREPVPPVCATPAGSTGQ